MNPASEYWNNFYTQSPFKTGKDPSKLLQQMMPRLQKGKVLDVAMGEGQNAVFLALSGFAVKGFDISSVAVEHALSLADEHGVKIEAKMADLDLFLFGLMEYDSIIMTCFRPSVKRYYSEIIRSLKQGGTLLVDSLLIDDRKEMIPPDQAYRDYYFKPNELLRELAGLRILYYHEGLVEGHHIVHCLAQKPMDKDVAKYGLFNMGSNTQQPKKDSQRELLESLFKKKE